MLILLLMLGLASASSVFGVTAKKKHQSGSKSATGRTLKSKAVTKRLSASRVSRRHAAAFVASGHFARASRRRLRPMWNPWKEPTYADSTQGDSIDGEDLMVRRAAVEALGMFNGTVVVSDAFSGRVLTMVNQHVALKSGFQPCSTIKIIAALAGLSEGVIDRDTNVRVYGRRTMRLTEALARSNNPYFANIGQHLGFERVTYYARLYGLGEKAGLNIEGEQPGTLPQAIPSEGLGMMTSFGSGILLTPLQLAAIMSTIANGGTLYYLQYPRNQEEADNFSPRVKRKLEIGQWIPEIRPGMEGAVEFGTARRAGWDNDEPIMGKTGTCTDARSPTHLGWFGSFNEVGKARLVVVVLLTGGRGVSGSAASGVAGQVYKNLAKLNYLQQPRAESPVALVSTQICCAAGSSKPQ
jgi:penicillin-binding protein 2